MVVALHVFVIPKDSRRVKVEHVFYAYTEAEADEAFKAHAAGCEFLGPAIAEKRVEEEVEDIDDADWPEFPDEDADDEEDEEGEDEEK